MVYKSVLVISDTHIPYGHPDTLEFLKSLKKKYKPDLVVHIGDEIDNHAISFHDSDPDLMSPGDELQSAIKKLEAFYKLFPKMKLIDSNHGSLVYRKQKTHGLPRWVFKSYREILQAPRGWSWSMDLTIKTPQGKVYFHHGKNKPVMKTSQNMAMSVVQGHYHENFSVNYWANPNGLFWQMQVGCLIDDKSMAFAYNKCNLNRPIIGTGLIVNGLPVLEPMILDKSGRWTDRADRV